MAINDWLSEDGQKAIAIMGWPEWIVGVEDRELSRCGIWSIEGYIEAEDRWTGLYEPSNHEALCLLQNRARARLDAHEIEIHGVGDGHYMAWHRGEHRYLTHMGKFEAPAMQDDAMFWGYDLALIAPMLAVGKEKQ